MCVKWCQMFLALSLAIPSVLFSAVPGRSMTDSTLTQSPEPSIQFLIITNNECKVIGTIAEPESDPVVIITRYGKLSIPSSDIKSIVEMKQDNMVKGIYWFPNPNSTRLFFAPTARMLNKGEGYFADYYLFFPSASYAFSGNFILNGGMSLFPGTGLVDQLYYIAPKFGLTASGHWHFAAGGMFVSLPEFDEEEEDPDDQVRSLGILYGVTTVGTENSGLTLGLGYGYVDDHMADRPVVVIGGERRVSRRISLVTENWFIPELNPAIVSYGIRFMGEKMSVDLAFITVTGSDAIFPGIPMVDFVINF
ncbi:hypothetical protein JW948_17710 [bacterium]|nr:hypothetical protein [bacterium]